MSEQESKPTSLRRVVGLRGAIFLGLGSIMGSGVFISIGLASNIIYEGVLLALIFAGLIALANALSSAQLAAAHPVSGGTYEYGHRFINPLAGFCAGFMYLAAKSASAATAALACSAYFVEALSSQHFVLQIVSTNTLDKLTTPFALLLIASCTLLVSSGLKRSNRANTLIVLVTLLSLASFVALSFAWKSQDLSPLILDAFGKSLRSPKDFLNASALLFVAYTGYGRIATLGEEVHHPQTTIPRAIVITVFIALFVYLAVAFAALQSVGAQEFAKITLISNAPLQFIPLAWEFPPVAWFTALGAITAMVGVLINLLLGLSRVLLAMARRGEMPRPFATLNKTQNPKNAVYATGVLIALIACSGDIAKTWSFSAFAVLIYYSLTNLAALKLPKEKRRFSKIVSLFGLVTCLVAALCVDLKSCLIGIGVLFIGLVWRTLTTRQPTKR